MVSNFVKKNKWLVLILILLSIVRCGEDHIHIDDDEELDKNFGVLYFNINYLEGVPTFENISFIVESLDRSNFLRVVVTKNSSVRILIPMRAGFYTFRDAKALADPDYKSLYGDASVKSFEGFATENLFEVKPGKINYIGDITVQVKRQQIGKTFLMRATGSPFREKVYFFNVHLSKSLKKLKKEYPNLTKRYTITNTKILYENESYIKKEDQREKEGTEGYGPNQYGPDKHGYGHYKWGMTVEEVELHMDATKRKHRLAKKNLLLDYTKGPKKHFYFSTLPVALWRNRLYKVTIAYKRTATSLLKLIKNKYGIPKRKENRWIWEIPSTFIILEKKGSKKSELTYISKKHMKFSKKKGK